jgi:hypothetical protein
LALIEMPAGKLLRLPEDWEKYRKPEATARLSAPIAQGARRTA